jgi:RNA polymerase sigma-70 factor (ECF subfamily)
MPTGGNEDPHARDLLLVRSALEGDRVALRALLSRLDCIARILWAVNERVPHPLVESDIEDLSQNTAMIIWRKLDRFEGRARLETWVYRIAYLEFMNYYRKRLREDSVSHEGDAIESRLEAPSRPDGAEIEEIERAVEALDPPLPEIIRLKHHRGLTFREIGETLEISPNSAKTFYYRGIETLRARFAPDEARGDGARRTTG